MATSTLPRFVVIKSNYYSGKGNAYYKAGDSVTLGEKSVFSTLVKIEAERATSNDKYVNLRFCCSNRYWSGNANDKFVVAESKQAEEDTTSPSCTLFEPIEVDGEKGVFYLTHVGSGGRLLIDEPTMAFYVELNPGSEQGYLTFSDWETFVNMPAHVAFKGDNGKYLKGVVVNGNPFLQFSSGDPNDEASGHEVQLMDDGSVRIKSDHFGKFWRRSPNWIWADSIDTTSNNSDTLFWLVKVDDNTIALRNAGNNNFCCRLTAENNYDCLNAASPTIKNEARLGVEELVLERKIYNVRYLMEDARILDEMPYLAGSSTLDNDKDEEASMTVSITYEDSKSYTFSCSVSLKAGVTTSFQTGVPFIVKGEIRTSFEISAELQWDTTTTTTTSVTASGMVPVPARTRAIVDYVGTRGTCNLPYTYTQQDKHSTDGKIVYADQVDGIYNGVSYYNFEFVVRSTRSL